MSRIEAVFLGSTLYSSEILLTIGPTTMIATVLFAVAISAAAVSAAIPACADFGPLIKLLIFAIFGVMAVQLTYFVAIDKSNAPTATILQYLFPVLIVLFSAVRSRKAPSKKKLRQYYWHWPVHSFW